MADVCVVGNYGVKYREEASEEAPLNKSHNHLNQIRNSVHVRVFLYPLGYEPHNGGIEMI